MEVCPLFIKKGAIKGVQKRGNPKKYYLKRGGKRLIKFFLFYLLRGAKNKFLLAIWYINPKKGWTI